jgi:hypothetical protein
LKSPLIPNPLGRGSVFDLEENTLAFADFWGEVEINQSNTLEQNRYLKICGDLGLDGIRKS